MKAIIIAVLMMLVAGFFVQQASASGITSFGQGSFVCADMNRMETKMAEALKNLGAKSQIGTPNTESKQDNSMIAPMNNSSSLAHTGIDSTTDSKELDLEIDDELSSLESSTNSIAVELESIKSETSSLGASQDVVRSSPKPYLAANDLSAFNTSALNSTVNSTKLEMISIESSLLNDAGSNASVNLTEVNLTKDSLLVLYPAARDVNLNSTGFNSSADTSLGQGKIDSTQSGQNIATQQIGGSVSGAVNGFWGLQSNQHKIGGNDINSRTFLSGGFEVDKSVKFSDRGI